MKRLLVTLFLFASPVWAVEPAEMLDDPVLEERARELSKGLRCPVCQNESIDESSAVLAAQLRVLLRERLVAGDSDEEAVDYLVARFGEFILLRPDASGANIILWLAAPAMLLIAMGAGWSVVRRRPQSTDTLTEAEEEEVQKILRS